MLLEKLLEVVGAGGKHAAVGAELDVLHHHGDVAVLALQALLVQQLQEDALVLVVHVLHRLGHLQSVSLQHKSACKRCFRRAGWLLISSSRIVVGSSCTGLV